MALGIPLLLGAALATAEFCAEPFNGGVGEPQFCRITQRQEISTPYFSMFVEPDFIAGIHHEGNRIQVQSTLWQSPNELSIERIEGSEPPAWPDCTKITETVEQGVTWQDCQISTDGLYQRRLSTRLKDAFVVIEYSYTLRGAETGPALERMTQSVRVHAI